MSSTPLILSIDQGTSSTRCIVFEARVGETARPKSTSQREHSQIYPKSGYVEHDPEEIWEKTKLCISEAFSNLKDSAPCISAIGITNQRETTVVWNRKTGKPYHNAIVWNDNRTADICCEFSAKKDQYRATTGLPLAPYFSVSKLVYLFRTVPGLREDADKGDVCFGNIDSWLIWKLTGGSVHATDVTNASRTFLMDLKTLSWDHGLLKDFGIPESILPRIRPSSFVFGKVAPYPCDVDSLKCIIGVPIAGVLGDQQAALFGQTCFDVGDSKCTYGTGAFILMNTGTSLRTSSFGLLSTVAYQTKDGQAVYALEGSVAYSGSVIQWLRDNLKIISNAGETEGMARTVEDGSGGVVFVPAFSGLFAPHWKDDARGAICGLTAFHTREHIVRAALESAAFQVCDVLEAMSADCPDAQTTVEHVFGSGPSKSAIQWLRCDGGMTTNNVFMQFQCDILNIKMSIPSFVETTALGACYAAGLSTGVWDSLETIKRTNRSDNKRWAPLMSPEKRLKLKAQWSAGLSRSMNWLKDIEVKSEKSSDIDCAVAKETWITAAWKRIRSVGWFSAGIIAGVLGRSLFSAVARIWTPNNSQGH